MIEKVKSVINDPEAVADRTAKKVLEILDRQGPIQKLRRSQVITTISGTAG